MVRTGLLSKFQNTSWSMRIGYMNSSHIVYASQWPLHRQATKYQIYAEKHNYHFRFHLALENPSLLRKEEVIRSKTSNWMYRNHERSKRLRHKLIYSIRGDFRCAEISIDNFFPCQKNNSLCSIYVPKRLPILRLPTRGGIVFAVAIKASILMNKKDRLQSSREGAVKCRIGDKFSTVEAHFFLKWVSPCTFQKSKPERLSLKKSKTNNASVALSETVRKSQGNKIQ